VASPANFTVRTLIQRKGNSIPFNRFIQHLTVLKNKIIKNLLKQLLFIRQRYIYIGGVWVGELSNHLISAESKNCALGNQWCLQIYPGLS
jgi:hypothetical protein